MGNNKNNKILHLVLKRKWWDMIAAGEKKEEYRNFSSFYIKRLCDNPCFNKEGKLINREPIGNWTISYCEREGISLREALKSGNMIFKDFSQICFHLGYTNTTMTYEIKSMSVGTGREEWGAETNKEYFVISLGKSIPHDGIF